MVIECAGADRGKPDSITSKRMPRGHRGGAVFPCRTAPPARRAWSRHPVTLQRQFVGLARLEGTSAQAVPTVVIATTSDRRVHARQVLLDKVISSNRHASPLHVKVATWGTCAARAVTDLVDANRARGDDAPLSTLPSAPCDWTTTSTSTSPRSTESVWSYGADQIVDYTSTTLTAALAQPVDVVVNLVNLVSLAIDDSIVRFDLSRERPKHGIVALE